MSLADIMSDWHQRLEGLEGDDSNEARIGNLIDQDPIEETEEEDNEEMNEPEQFAYRNLNFKAPAYEWLLASFCREFHLASAELSSMKAIRRKIIGSLPLPYKISRKKPAPTYKMIFEMEWDPLAFLKEQEYREEPGEAMEMAITLTGSARDAQALTCAQYLRQTWPSSAEQVIRIFKDVVRSEPGTDVSSCT